MHQLYCAIGRLHQLYCANVDIVWMWCMFALYTTDRENLLKNNCSSTWRVLPLSVIGAECWCDGTEPESPGFQQDCDAFHVVHLHMTCNFTCTLSLHLELSDSSSECMWLDRAHVSSVPLCVEHTYYLSEIPSDVNVCVRFSFG